jgi:hypothetical protein
MPKIVEMSQPTKETLMNNLLGASGLVKKMYVKYVAAPADASQPVEGFTAPVNVSFTVDDLGSNQIAELTTPVIIPIPFNSIETALGKELSTVQIQTVYLTNAANDVNYFIEAVPLPYPIFTGIGELTVVDFDIFMFNQTDYAGE